ncbi:MAG TPA: hypothetical protein VFU30_09345 [Gaiellaceae bacterium]|nr:hypothetical protein [Gaiellaceae bacterium]
MSTSEERVREEALRELFELAVLTSDELRAELAAEPERDKEVRLAGRVRSGALD